MFFDGAFLINLDKRKDRLEKSLVALKEMDISAERFSAISFSQPILSIYNLWIPEKDLGRYGCLISHLNIIKEARNRKLKNVLIIEDDVYPDTGFKQFANEAVQELSQRTWNMFYFYGSEKSSPEGKYINRLNNPPWGAYFYAINSTFFDQIIYLIENSRGPHWWYAIDSIYLSFIRENVYCTNKNIVLHRDMKDSDIDHRQ